MEVKSLDTDLKANIRSGYCVNNVTQCINELVLNSLDANSSHISVLANLTTFRIQVVDDGEGITESNLEHIGKRNYTNKCHSSRDLEKVRKQFGYKGESLSSIANNAKTIKITTRSWDVKNSQSCGTTFLKTIEGKRHLIEETSQRASGGTTITILGFMYNLPVRQKRTKTLEFNDIKAILQKLFILHPNVTFSLRDDSTKKDLFSTTAVDTVESALRQQMDNVDEKLIKYYSITRGRTTVKVLIYLKLYENNKWQLFYVNKLPIKSLKLCTFVNEILSKSALVDNNKTAPKGKNAENFLYLYNIVCPNSKYQILNYNEVEFKNLDSILKVINRQLDNILDKEKLSKALPEKKREENQLERRIRLSGFPGAFKASAVKKTGDNVDDIEEDIQNFVYNPEFNRNVVSARGRNSKITSTQESTHLTSSYSDNNTNNCNQIQINKEMQNYYYHPNNHRAEDNQVNEPLETTSTIGKNYVLNKFLEDNPYMVHEQMAPMKKNVTKEMQKRKFGENIASREAIFLEHANVKRSYEYKAPETEKRQKEINSWQFIHDFHKIRNEREPQQNKIALANYYRHKLKHKHHAKQIKQQRKQQKENQQFLWDDTQNLEFKNFDVPSPKRYQIPPKIPNFAPLPFEDNNTHKNKKFSLLYPEYSNYKVPEKSTSHEFFKTNQHKPLKQNNFDFQINFEQLNKQSFNFPVKFSRNPRHARNFAQTVYDLDLSAGDNFKLPFPAPEERKRNFFRMRASEKTTRLKQFHLDGKRRCAGKRMKINCKSRISTLTTDYPMITINSGTNMKRRRTKTKTLISYCKSRQTIAISTKQRTSKHERKHCTSEEVKIEKNVDRKRKKIKLKTNKGTNTSIKEYEFNQNVQCVDKTLIMMEQSIQCTIANHLQKSGQAENVFTPPDVTKVNVISNILICEPEKTANINLEENNSRESLKKVQEAEKEDFKEKENENVDEEIIQGTPCDRGGSISFFLPWLSQVNHPLQKIEEIDQKSLQIEPENKKSLTPTGGGNCFNFIQENVTETVSLNEKNEKVNDVMIKNSSVPKNQETKTFFDCQDVEKPEEFQFVFNETKKDETLMFNLSSAVKELAEEFSFSKPTNNTQKKNELITKSPIDGFIFDFGETPNQQKQKTTSNDIFGFDEPSIQQDLFCGEWSRKIDDQGGSYYVNQRTGNTMSQLPLDQEIFDLNKRPIDLPKGFSPIVKETLHIAETISNETKREYHAAVCESYKDDELDLARVKWKKNYLQSVDYNEFFQRIYDPRFIINDEELKLPKVRQFTNSLNPVAFTKDMFQQLDVLRQYDCKFIVALWKPRKMIVIFDQHAAHERVRLNELFRKYVRIYYDSATNEKKLQLKSTQLKKSFDISLNLTIIERCSTSLKAFKKFGIDIAYDEDDDRYTINSVPECFFNKALRENSRRQEKLLELTKLLVFEILESIEDAVCTNQWVPRIVINLINSEACRGAVMFGDALSIEECGKLINDLSSCDLPFQCAHGRPTCAPLFELKKTDEETKTINFAALRNFKRSEK